MNSKDELIKQAERSRWKQRTGLWTFVAAMMLFGPSAGAEDKPSKSAVIESKVQAAAREVELRGRVVCLAEEMHRLFQSDLPTRHEHLYGFKTQGGKFYTLLRTKLSEALFVDQRLREKELILRGRVLPGAQVFEMTAMRSVRNGVVHDLYYYCDVCEIKSVSPEPCACCQGPVELVERPR